MRVRVREYIRAGTRPQCPHCERGPRSRRSAAEPQRQRSLTPAHARGSLATTEIHTARSVCLLSATHPSSSLFRRACAVRIARRWFLSQCVLAFRFV
jgi:hypothetical protein